MIFNDVRGQFLREAPVGPADSAWHLPALDVLRGLAATWVVLFHMVYLTTPNMAPPILIDRLIKSGGIGVTLFFVVSAFSLCLSGQRHANEGAWPFYLRRLFRIAPLFYVILAVSLLRDQIFFGVQHSYVEVVASALFFFNFVAGWQEGIVWASWTIGIEMAFYLLFPVIWQRTGGLAQTVARTMMLACISVIAYACISYFADGAQFWQWSLFKHMPSFLLGMVIFELWQSLTRRLPATVSLSVGSIALAAGLLLGLALYYSDQPFPLMAPLYWQAIICALVVLGATLGAARRFFSLSALRWLGRNSYSIYLSHPLVIVALQPTYRKIAAGTQSAPLVFMLCAFLTLGCIFVVSELCWHLIERPGVQLGSRVIRSLKLMFQQRNDTAGVVHKTTGVTNV